MSFHKLHKQAMTNAYGSKPAITDHEMHDVGCCEDGCPSMSVVPGALASHVG